MREYSALMASGRPVTWTMLLVGWGDGLVTNEELQWYAADQLGRCSGEMAAAIFGLYDAAPYRAEVQPYIEALAAAELGDPAQNRERAMRMWNVIAAQIWLQRYIPRDSGMLTRNDVENMAEDLVCFPYNTPFPDVCRVPWDQTPLAAAVWGASELTPSETYRHIVEAARAWLAEEEEALRAESRDSEQTRS